MAQQPTNWDRFFNSTISMPQQFLWRIQRAMQEDDIDLFSEKGILDASLIPVLGILDDHKNDVMPDYMFGEGMGSQIAGSIAYDPLTYMSGGLSAFAKLAQMGNKVRSMPMIANKMAKAFAKIDPKTGKNIGVGKMTLGQLDEVAGEALKSENRKLFGRSQRRTLKAFRKNLAKQGDDMYAETLDGILKHEGKRQLAWRVPILWRAGAKINTSPKYQNWWEFWSAQKNTLSSFVKAKTVAHAAPLIGPIGKLPFAREAAKRAGTAIKFLNAPGHIGSIARAWGRGWSVGGDAAYAPALKLNDAQLSEQSAFLRTDNSLLRERILEHGPKVFRDAFTKLIKGTGKDTRKALEDPMRAFVRTFGGTKIPGTYRNAPKEPEKYEHLAKRIFGKMVGEPDISQWGDETLELFNNTFKSGRQNAIHNVDVLVKDYLTKADDAWKSLYGNLAHTKRTKAGEALKVHLKGSPRKMAMQKLDEWEGKLEAATKSRDAIKTGGKGSKYWDFTQKMLKAEDKIAQYTKELAKADTLAGKLKDVIKDTAFKAGKATASIQGKAFRGDTGLRDLINAEKILRQHENMGADQARAIGELLYKLVKPAAKQEGMNPEKYLKTMGNLFEGVLNPDELIQSFNFVNMTAEDTLRSLDAVNRFLNRHVSALETMGGLAQKGSLTRNSLGRLERNLESGLLDSIPRKDEDYIVHLISQSVEDAAKGVKRVLPDEMLNNPANMHHINYGGVRGELGVLSKAELAKARQVLLDKGTREWTKKDYREWVKNTPKGRYVAKFKKRFKLSDADLAKAVSLPTDGLWLGPNQIRKVNGKSIDGDALKRLKRYLNQDETAVVLKQATKFDRDMLGELGKAQGKNFVRDLERIDHHSSQRLNGAIPIDGYKPSFDAGKQQAMPGKWGDTLATEVTHANNKDVGPWADSFVRAKVLQNELAVWVEKNAKAINDPHTPLVVPQELLDDLMREASRTSDQLWDLVYKGHTEGGAGQEFMDLIRNYQSAVLHQSIKSGIVVPGAPLGYMGRFLKGQERKALDDLMARGDVRDVMNRLGIKLPSYFGRDIKADEMVVEELNDMYRVLGKAHTREARAIQKEIDTILEQGTGSKEFLKHWEEDPILRTVTRLSHAAQNDTIEKFFDAAMDGAELVSGKDVGQALAVSGRVVGWFDDTGNKNIYKRRTLQVLKEEPVRKKGRIRATASEIKEEVTPGVPQRLKFESRRVGGIDETMEQTMKGVLIEVEQGGKTHQIAVSNDQLKNGMGILSLGEADEYTRTTANAFVRAINRADLDKTFIRGQFRNKDLTELQGKHVVFGNESMVAGTVNMTRNLLDVTPKALRTLDTMNYAIKSWQTVFRLPFHIANMTSGVFQAMIAGASPADVMAGYYHAGRMLFKADTKWHRLHDRSISALEQGKVTPGEGLRLGRGEFVAAARRIGSGWLGDVDPKVIEEYGLDEVNDFLIPVAGGGNVSAGELLRLAATEGLYGTYASAGMRGSQTISDTLLRVKADALDPEMVRAQGHSAFAVAIEKAKRATMNIASGRPGEFGRALTEASEVWNRTGTAMALIRAGNSPRRAVQMAKMSHVPYEQVTSFEKNFLKRGIMYYTFPRHYIPFAWGKFIEDPKKLARITNTIRQSTALETKSGDVGFTQFEGKPVLKVGDYRVDVGRLNSNIESALMFNSFLEQFAMPVVRGMGAGEPVDPRWLSRQTTDMGLLSTGGLGSIIGADRRLFNTYPTAPKTSDTWTDKLLKATWPVKMLAQGLGAVKGEWGLPQDSPYVEKTFLEKALSHPDLGLPFRKVREQNEVKMAQLNYQKLMADLKARYMSASLNDDTEEMELITENIEEVAEALSSLQERETASTPDLF